MPSSCWFIAAASAGTPSPPPPVLAAAGDGGNKSGTAPTRYNYKAMFVFGDSLADTGNMCANKSSADPILLTFAQPPYGMTYFGHPTCRCSDGRLVVDFLAQELGLPLLPPSRKKGVDFGRGVSMAIVGATALDFEFLKSIGLGYDLWNNGAINVQFSWFRRLLPSICRSRTPHSCRAYLAKSLFVFGSFGGNDYNAMLLFGFTVDQARNYTPKIVDNIARGVEKVIEMGAMDIVVPGITPLGCFPIYLNMLQTSNKSDYDHYGCLKDLNSLAIHHNSLLRTKLAGIQSRHTSSSPATKVRIMYADYYTNLAEMMRRPSPSPSPGGIAACCGAGGGEYNWEFDARCGMKGATACADPARFVCWDGIHPTEAANRVIAGGWLRGPSCHPPILKH
uniref:Esterase n=1 Tax=Leersia perrieri TaxID=77586 RepID=A0A0D9WLC1_9ORYZ